jgi:AP2-associated kinase
MGASSSRVIQIGALVLKPKVLLGEGRHAQVWLVKETKSKVRYACKAINAEEEERRQIALAEAELLRKMGRHPHIISYCGHVDDVLEGARDSRGARVVFILMELAAHGSLADDIAKRRGSPEANQTMRPFSEQEALRDLKAENVLVCDGPTYKLCDLGSAAVLRPKSVPRSAAERTRNAEHLLDVTTPAYRAPEMAQAWGEDDAAGTASDIWALGCEPLGQTVDTWTEPATGLGIRTRSLTSV